MGGLRWGGDETVPRRYVSTRADLDNAEWIARHWIMACTSIEDPKIQIFCILKK
jgi:hypothetical protein